MKDCPDHDPDDPIPTMELSDRNRVIDIIFQRETPEVKAAVQAEKTAMDARIEREQEGEDLGVQVEVADDADDAAAGKQKRENDKKNQAYNE